MKLFSCFIPSSPSLFNPAAAISLHFWLPRGLLSFMPPPQQGPEGSTCPNRDLYRPAMCSARYAVQRSTQPRKYATFLYSACSPEICNIFLIMVKNMKNSCLGFRNRIFFFFLGYISWLKELERLRIRYRRYKAVIVLIWSPACVHLINID